MVTVPIGYGDGFPRALSSRGRVLVGGRQYPIVGRVCMDQFMVDIGQDSAWNEGEVVLFGRQGDVELRVEGVAEAAGMIAYEILVGLNDRIPRVYRSTGYTKTE